MIPFLVSMLKKKPNSCPSYISFSDQAKIHLKNRGKYIISKLWQGYGIVFSVNIFLAKYVSKKTFDSVNCFEKILLKQNNKRLHSSSSECKLFLVYLNRL